MPPPRPPPLPPSQPPPLPTQHGPANILMGIVRLAVGRADGAGRFAGTVPAFLSSLAPVLAFLLVGMALRLVQESPAPVLGDVAAALCGLLAPAVLSHALAAAWGREGGWLRYAVAYNWCQWALLPVLLAILVVLGVAAAAGLPLEAAGNLALLLCMAYGLWLHWFLTRTLLDLGTGRAAVFVLLVNLGTTALFFGPRLLALALNPGAVPS